MRKQGLIFLIIVAALVIFVNSVATDRWIERRMEKFGSRITGARVEFERVDFSPFGLSLGWDGLQVADPDDTWTNLFETGSCTFDLALEPLMKRKFVVEDFNMQGLRFGTPRKTDGALRENRRRPLGESKVVQAVERNIKAEVERYPLLNLGILRGTVDVDSLWEAAVLESPERIGLLKERYISKYDEWDARMADLPGEDEMGEMGRDIESIRVDQIDTPQEVKESYDLLQKLEERAGGYYRTVRQARNDLLVERASLSQVDDEITAWIEEDYQRVLALADLPELSREGISRMLFGERIAARMEKVLRVMGRVRTYSQKVGKYIPAKEFPPRGAGQDIRFSTEREYPGFWIQRLRLTGETARGIEIGGVALDVVSDQQKINRPTILQIGGERRDGAGLDFSALIDGRGVMPREQFELVLEGLPLEGLTLTDFPFLSYPLSGGVAAVEGRIDFTGSDFLAELGLRGTGISFDTQIRPDELDDELYQLSLAMVRRVKNVELDASVMQTGEEFSLHIRSNLDSIVLDGLKETMSEELQNIRSELEDRIEAEVGSARDEVRALIAAGEDRLERGVGEAEQLVQEQLALVEQKRREIDRRIKAEEQKLQKEVEEELRKQEEKLQERGRDLLDSLL